MPTFSFNRIVIAQLVGFALAGLAALHVTLPSTMSATNIVAAIMLVSAAVTGVLRLYHPGDPLASAKPVLASKTILTSIVAAGFALLALLGIVPSIDQANVVEAVMTLVSIATVLFGGTARRAVG